MSPFSSMLNRLQQVLPFGEFTRNVVGLTAGSVASQLVPLLVSPILTRMYSPEDFGVYSLYFSCIMIASTFATARYELAIVVPKEHREGLDLLKLSMTVCVGVTLITFLLVAFLYDPLLSLIRGPKGSFNLFWVPLGILVTGFSQSLYYYHNRFARFRVMSIGRITRGVGYAFASILIGIFIPAGSSLIVADITSYSLSNTYMLRVLGSNLFQISWPALKEVSVRYSSFPRFSIGSGLIEKGSTQSPTFMMSSLFGSVASAGYFSLAQRLIPSDLIGRAVGDVFRQKAAELMASQGQCKELFITTTKKLSLAGLALFSVAYVVIKPAVRIIFGEAWGEIANFSQIMMPLFLFQFVASPVSSLVQIGGKQHIDLIIQIFTISGVFLSFFVGHHYYNSIHVALKLYTLTYCIRYSIEFYVSWRLSLGHEVHR
ncbi:MAG: lipopolysaccharide biosynthesis protein [Cyclobacteriaceae bacterium]|nr:lipopolysaccharide biosynthesis protein [Cyclobacteriaceae bacterium]